MNSKQKQLVENRMVIKVGGDTLTNSDGSQNQGALKLVADQAKVLIAQGKQVVIVTSGGIKAGLQTLAKLGVSLPDASKKLLAGIGAENLISSWAKAFEPFRIAVAQFWLTHANWDHEGEVKSIRETLLEALANGIVPIINENDVVSDAEIRLMLKGWGENDNMAARVASLVGASSVLFLSTVGWIYEANPKEHKTARRYKVIDAHNIPVTLLLPNGTSPHGDGKNGINSIKTKVDAAAFCFRFGARASIASLFAGPEVIVSFGLATKEYGTRMGTENKFIE